MAIYRLLVPLVMGDPGLTLQAQFYDENGAPVGTPITRGFQDFGHGSYTWNGTIPSRTFRGTIKFSSVTDPSISATTVINPEEEDIAQGHGLVSVDHDYTGPCGLCVMTPDRAPVDGASIYVYPADDYNAGRRQTQYVVGSSETDSNGRWHYPVFLDPGDYVLLIFKSREIVPAAISLHVAPETGS